jgi:23S rRNA (adenine2503-C2)-methyltransferase
MFEVLSERGNDSVARIFIAQTRDGHRFEFVDAGPRILPQGEPWVLVLSTLIGCPVRCRMCDAGGGYEGRLTTRELLGQVHHLVRRRFPEGLPEGQPVEVHLTRMGEPAFNEAVLEALSALPKALPSAAVTPLVSTVAPASTRAWFEALLELKQQAFADGRFQLQFSMHSTDEDARRRLVPVRCWTFDEMADYGRRFHAPGDRKVQLSFAPAQGVPVDPRALRGVFDPGRFGVKLTSLNPTSTSRRSGLVSLLEGSQPASAEAIAAGFRQEGFEVLVSLGEGPADELGSSCGMSLAGERLAVPRPRRTLGRSA